MDEMSSNSGDVQAVPRRTQTGSQTYQRYSLTTAQGESTEKLGPIQPPQAQHDGQSVNIQPTAGMAAKDEPSDAANNDSGDQATQSSPALKGGRWFLVVVAILINTFVYAIDNTIVAVIQPAIVQQFGDLVDLPWVSVGFILGGTATALPLTGLYSALDAKWLYIAFTIIFAAASALCGAAPTMPALIVGRVIAGVGGNGMYLGAITLLSVFSEPAKTPIYIGYIGLSWGAGTVIGPIIGGAFVSSAAGWRWAFYINLIIGAVSTPILLILTPNFRPRPLDVSAVKALQNIDWLGAGLSFPAFVLGITAISFGGTQFPWDGAFIVSMFWAAGFLFFTFWLQQLLLFRTTLPTRLFPIHFFAKKDLLLLFIIQACAGGIVVIPLYLLALYYPFAQGDTAIQAGVKLLPLVAFLVAAIIFNGYAMGAWGYHQVWIVFGGVLVLVSGVFFSRLTVNTTNATIYGLQVVLGIGTGAFSQAGFAIAQAMVEPTEIQNAISFMLIAQLTGTSLGLSISQTVFQNLSVPRVAEVLGPGFTPEQVTRIVTRIDEALIASLPADLYRQAQNIVIDAITNGLVLVYAGGALCLVCGVLLTPNARLLGKQAERRETILQLDENVPVSGSSEGETHFQHSEPQ
ncbi:MFS general substrate transporter [Hypoxylon crocopeplum]|nr:MFS general substrate transporter [Hypoxylon crocopeplum]